MGHLFVLSWTKVRRVSRGECCFGIMYCEWYGVCDFVVLSVVEVCRDYGGVNVFHVCLNLVLLLRFVWVCEWCISSQVCIVAVCISDEPSVWLHLIEGATAGLPKNGIGPSSLGSGNV